MAILSLHELRLSVGHFRFPERVDEPAIMKWLAIAFVALPILFMLALAAQPFVDPADLLRDPLAVAELRQPACCKVYYGAVSSLGVLMMMSGAAICLFSALLAISRGDHVAARMLAMVSFFTAWIAFDDLFLVHENVMPAFGISELVAYALFAAYGLAYVALFWRELLRHNYVLFGIACGFLATSVLIDFVFHNDSVVRLMIEDGSKLVGISAWTGFHVMAAWNMLQTRQDSTVSDPLLQRWN